jgi:hypothetical protein
MNTENLWVENVQVKARKADFYKGHVLSIHTYPASVCPYTRSGLWEKPDL